MTDSPGQCTQVVQLYSELAAGFESMITDDLINSPPDRMVAGALAQQANAAKRGQPRGVGAAQRHCVRPRSSPTAPGRRGSRLTRLRTWRTDMTLQRH